MSHQSKINFSGRVSVSQYNTYEKRLEFRSLFDNIVLDNCLTSITNFLISSFSLAYKVSHCVVGTGGNHLYENQPDRTSLSSPLSPGDDQNPIARVPVWSGNDFISSPAFIQSDLSVLFSFLFNFNNTLFSNYPGVRISEMGLVGQSGTNYFLLSYLSLEDRPFYIKEGIVSVVEYELKLRHAS